MNAFNELHPKSMGYFLIGVFVICGVIKAEQIDHARRTKPEIIWGESTNGIRGGVWVRHNAQNDAEVVVYAYLKSLTNSEAKTSEGAFSHSYHVTRFAPPYLMATNWFCGPIELRNSEGHDVPLLKCELSSAGQYPETLRWSILWSNEMQRPSTSHIVPGDKEFRTENGELTSFMLRDYFDLKEPGQYVFIVWPKIYRQSSKDRDLYQRIDIPPVTVTVKWSGRPK